MPIYNPGQETSSMTPPAPMVPGTYTLREVWVVTKRGYDGSVMDTEYLGLIWAPFDKSWTSDDPEKLLSCVSTTTAQQMIDYSVSSIIKVRDAPGNLITGAVVTLARAGADKSRGTIRAFSPAGLPKVDWWLDVNGQPMTALALLEYNPEEIREVTK